MIVPIAAVSDGLLDGGNSLGIASRGLLGGLVDAIHGGSRWLRSQAERARLLREDNELLEIISMILRSGILNGRM